MGLITPEYRNCYYNIILYAFHIPAAHTYCTRNRLSLTVRECLL